MLAEIKKLFSVIVRYVFFDLTAINFKVGILKTLFNM